MRKPSIASVILCSVLLISVACFGVAGYQNAKSSGSADCRGRLTCIVTAMHHYHEEFGRFPPAITLLDGQPAHSWRVLLLNRVQPQVFQQYRFDQPWNSPENIQLQNEILSCYRCRQGAPLNAPFATSYVLVRGDRCLYDSSGTISPVFSDDIRDCIFVVETTRTDIHWMSPVDLTFNELQDDLKAGRASMVGGLDLTGGHVATVDGRKLPISSLSPEEILTRLKAPSRQRE